MIDPTGKPIGNKNYYPLGNEHKDNTGGAGVYQSLEQSRQAYLRTGTAIVDGPKDLDAANAKIAELEKRLADIEALLSDVVYKDTHPALERIKRQDAKNKAGA